MRETHSIGHVVHIGMVKFLSGSNPPRSKAISVIDFFFVPVTISCPMVDPA
jgi:hypothetical protein